MYVVKTKVLISCATTAQLICAIVFAYAKSRLSNDASHIYLLMIRYLLYAESNQPMNQ